MDRLEQMHAEEVHRDLIALARENRHRNRFGLRRGRVRVFVADHGWPSFEPSPVYSEGKTSAEAVSSLPENWKQGRWHCEVLTASSSCSAVLLDGELLFREAEPPAENRHVFRDALLEQAMRYETEHRTLAGRILWGSWRERIQALLSIPNLTGRVGMAAIQVALSHGAEIDVRREDLQRGASRRPYAGDDPIGKERYASRRPYAGEAAVGKE